MVWPSKLTDLDHAGYSYTGTGKICDCGTRTLFFVNPERKHIALSALRDSRLVPHHSVCVGVKELRATTRRQDDGARNSTVQPLLFFEESAAAPNIRSAARPTAGSIFGGPAYQPSLDRARLELQVERIRAWALAREWFTIREAREDLERVYRPTIFPENSVAAQLRNLEKAEAGRLRCKKEKRRRDGRQEIWEYRLLSPAPAEAAEEQSRPARHAIREKFFSSHAGFDPSTHVGSAKKGEIFNG